MSGVFFGLQRRNESDAVNLAVKAFILGLEGLGSTPGDNQN